MSSTNKTKNLNLNSWLGGDKPQRTDFVYDNEVVDEVVGNHIDDNNIHLTTADRKNFSTPVTAFTYIGDGSDRKTLELPVSCTAVFVIRLGKPPVEQGSNGKPVSNFSCSAYGKNASSALVFGSKTEIDVCNYSSSNGEAVNLNTSQGTYLVLCFR
jgi:hypothetical protein